MKTTKVHVVYSYNCWECGCRTEFTGSHFPKKDEKIILKCRRCKAKRLANFVHDPDNTFKDGHNWKKLQDLNEEWWKKCQERIDLKCMESQIQPKKKNRLSKELKQASKKGKKK